MLPRLTEIFLIAEDASVNVKLNADEQELILKAFDALEKKASPEEKKHMESIFDKLMGTSHEPAKHPPAKDTANSNVQTYSHDKRYLKNSRER